MILILTVAMLNQDFLARVAHASQDIEKFLGLTNT